MSRTCLIRFAAALVVAASLAGPAALAQTPMALTNIGQRLDGDDARMAGRGGWGMATDDSTHPGFKNIASLSSIRNVALAFTALGERIQSEDLGGTRRTYRTYSPDLRVGLPVAKGRLAVTAGLQVNRSSRYATNVDSTWYAWEDTISGLVQFKREGSMFRVPLGAAWSPVAGVSLSAALNLERGTLRESLYNLLQDPASLTGVPLYQTNLVTEKDSYSGTSYTLGALLAPHDRIRLGFSYTPAFDLTVDRKFEMGGVSTRVYSDFEMRMPAEILAGIEVDLAGRWRAGADYRTQDFGSFTGRDDWREQMVQETGLGLGLERARATVRHGGKSNLPLRLGFRTRTWAYLVGGKEIRETAFSAGTGFPFRGDMGQLDVALSYVMLGDLADNGMQSRAVRLTISVTGLERWW